ncbi:spore maturation protein cgeB [Paenibacillus thermoaerophilus]|uniref:CgeB family protein n=1 Tax=Paenibacillus thermoaerophilus TaxID=1215385 RepID=UPI00110DDE53|nr:glycosyltransferase [Paenibacillus thermoaerophilus]TMV17718.1 spore maturation protein cgeB [Paenibacillus thermoaerophilus]
MARNMRPSASLARYHRAGREAGYAEGLAAGYHLGRCEAVNRQISGLPERRWDVKIMYVTSGKWYPYKPIDDAIARGLLPIVREVSCFRWRIPTRGYPKQDLVGAVLRERPDLVICLDGIAMDLKQIDRIRSAGFRTAVWLTDDPYFTDVTSKIALHFDYVFTLELNCVEFYKQIGCPQVHYLPLAADTAMFRPRRVEPGLRRDVSFIGSGYWNRVRAIDAVSPYLAAKRVRFVGQWWNRLRSYKRFARDIELNRWLLPQDTAAAYNGSKIVLNIHRAHDDASYNNNRLLIPAVSPNPRTFEIAACGAFQLTDVREDIVRFYVPGEEIVTYQSPEDMVAKIEYYLTHESERREIAIRALRKTLEQHTYPKRLAELLRIVFGD